MAKKTNKKTNKKTTKKPVKTPEKTPVVVKSHYALALEAKMKDNPSPSLYRKSKVTQGHYPELPYYKIPLVALAVAEDNEEIWHDYTRYSGSWHDEVEIWFSKRKKISVPLSWMLNKSPNLMKSFMSESWQPLAVRYVNFVDFYGAEKLPQVSSQHMRKRGNRNKDFLRYIPEGFHELHPLDRLLVFEEITTKYFRMMADQWQKTN